MEPQRYGPRKDNEELVDTLIAISVVAKRLATRIRTNNPKRKAQRGVNHERRERV